MLVTPLYDQIHYQVQGRFHQHLESSSVDCWEYVHSHLLPILQNQVPLDLFHNYHTTTPDFDKFSIRSSFLPVYCTLQPKYHIQSRQEHPGLPIIFRHAASFFSSLQLFLRIVYFYVRIEGLADRLVNYCKISPFTPCFWGVTPM